ncbi:tRNA pseudouridine(55) synthase TruB [Gordonibacter sp. Marseille-P4307]|uniref:tRNA pseudouridine(55) synthase TruB n=1 Tax=Gordonibacter sp. Marseille-P4307 TaxID=2161815 RepID=UPI000F539D3A|nr:tRNA pseudouridine(55) synthase TruB [Gordonibacter sp. Marseille-P4307]
MKRAATDHSLLVAIDKPQGMSSHDVVNRCRRIFGEKRIGHTGTLDPLATGVLPICIGPATRLDRFMVGHDKTYDVRIAFGYETATDDREGTPTIVCPVSARLSSESFARRVLETQLGPQMQVPPQYSAVKIDGKPAYARARAGTEVALEPRAVEVYAADLLGIVRDDEGDLVFWDVRFSVSKGTYIRSLARSVGRVAQCPAHVFELRRTRAGSIRIEDCVTLEQLEGMRDRAALDPVPVLGYRFAFVDEREALVRNGGRIAARDLELFSMAPRFLSQAGALCAPSFEPSCMTPGHGEVVSLVARGALIALYEFDSNRGCWKSCCGFSVGVSRG